MPRDATAFEEALRMIGNNSSGTKSIVFGKTIDHVEALKVLLAGRRLSFPDHGDKSGVSDDGIARNQR